MNINGVHIQTYAPFLCIYENSQIQRSLNCEALLVLNILNKNYLIGICLTVDAIMSNRKVDLVSVTPSWVETEIWFFSIYISEIKCSLECTFISSDGSYHFLAMPSGKSCPDSKSRFLYCPLFLITPIRIMVNHITERVCKH